ncbi:MAG: hypothetical protein JRI68_00155 [Deltaproteobacteria bacterium]|nr:hypothetical protein [Deltaproteobacteria bacterium]
MARSFATACAARAPFTTALAALVSLATATAGCLPGDDRPEPGSLLLNVHRSHAAAEGFETDDGWRLSFTRFATALGGLRLGGRGRRGGPGGAADDDCVDYSFSTYDRLYDFAVAGTSKLVLHYGLGHCSVPFSMGQPSPRAILMAGVTQADLELMGPGESGMFEENLESGIALLVMGRAEKDGVTKRFAWRLTTSYVIGECHAPTGDEVINSVELRGGEALVRELEIRPKELFRLTPSLEAPIEFTRFAQADVDDDGAVTLEELAMVDLPFEDIIEDLRDELPKELQDELSAQFFDEATLLTLVRDILAQRVAAYEGAGECVIGADYSKD